MAEIFPWRLQQKQFTAIYYSGRKARAVKSGTYKKALWITTSYVIELPWRTDNAERLTPSFSFSMSTFFSATSFFVFLHRALNTSLSTMTIRQFLNSFEPAYCFTVRPSSSQIAQG